MSATNLACGWGVVERSEEGEVGGGVRSRCGTVGGCGVRVKPTSKYECSIANWSNRCLWSYDYQPANTYT